MQCGYDLLNLGNKLYHVHDLHKTRKTYSLSKLWPRYIFVCMSCAGLHTTGSKTFSSFLFSFLLCQSSINGSLNKAIMFFSELTMWIQTSTQQAFFQFKERAITSPITAESFYSDMTQCILTAPKQINYSM